MPLIRTLKFAFHLKFWAITKKEKKFRCLDFRTLDSGKKCLFFTLYFYISDLENWMLWIYHCKRTKFGIFLRIQKQIFLTRKLICRFHAQDFYSDSRRRKSSGDGILLCIRFKISIRCVVRCKLIPLISLSSISEILAFGWRCISFCVLFSFSSSLLSWTLSSSSKIFSCYR